jgi:hypothetical protein
MQIGGNEENILSKNDLEKFAQKFNLSFEEITQKYGFFKRKSETLYKLVKK